MDVVPTKMVFFLVVPLQRGKRPMERVPLVKIVVFFVHLWCVFCALLREGFEFCCGVFFSFALVLCVLCRDVVVGLVEES